MYYMHVRICVLCVCIVRVCCSLSLLLLHMFIHQYIKDRSSEAERRTLAMSGIDGGAIGTAHINLLALLLKKVTIHCNHPAHKNILCFHHSIYICIASIYLCAKYIPSNSSKRKSCITMWVYDIRYQ
jgi:hypothetical protein